MTASRTVVGAIIVDSLSEPTRVLAARRTGKPPLAGRWEFPGGKVEPGEDPMDALRREVLEELGVRVEVGDEVRPPTKSYWPISSEFHLRLWFVRVLRGEPLPTGSHDKLRWLGSAELNDVRWLDSDCAAIPIVAATLGTSEI